MAKQTAEEEVIEVVRKILKNDEEYGIPNAAKEPILELFKYAYLESEIDPTILGKWTELGFVQHGKFGVNMNQLELQIAFMGLSWTTGIKAEMVPANFSPLILRESAYRIKLDCESDTSLAFRTSIGEDPPFPHFSFSMKKPIMTAYTVRCRYITH